MSKKEQTLELIEVLREELRAAGASFAVERCDELTESVLRRVVGRIGGAHVFVRSSVRSRAETEACVLSEFTGANQVSLGRRHGVSVRTIYRIIARQRDSEK